MLQGYVSRIASGKETTYFYKDDWAEQMQDAQPEIAEMVKKLKNKQ